MAAATTTTTTTTTTLALFFLNNRPSPKLPNKLHHIHSSSSSAILLSHSPPIRIHFLREPPQKKMTLVFKPILCSPAPGLYSAQQFQLTPANVDLVLDAVRPYLIADGGNVDVVSVENGVVALKLQGACGSCPSSTTTMKMGIERVLKEKFGDAVKEICQVYDEQKNEINVEAVNSHLDILRPAIKNYGGSVDVLSVEGGDCVVKYVGPESIGSGIKAAIKEKFPDIVNVVLTA